MRKIVFSLLLAFPFITAFSQDGEYEGKIGGKYAVVFSLQNMGKTGEKENEFVLLGDYYYADNDPNNVIGLSGVWNKSNNSFIIYESYRSELVGEFNGKFTATGMEGVHTNYARNTKLNFKFNKTNSNYTEDSYYSQQEQNFGRWRWIANKDEFGDDIPGQITVFNWLRSEYDWQIVISYTPQKGLMITDDPNEMGSAICNHSTITIKRGNGSVENIYSTYDNKTLYITGESMRKFFKIMDEGNFKMNIKVHTIYGQPEFDKTLRFNVMNELIGAENAKRVADEKR